MEKKFGKKEVTGKEEKTYSLSQSVFLRIVVYYISRE